MSSSGDSAGGMPDARVWRSLDATALERASGSRPVFLRPRPAGVAEAEGEQHSAARPQIDAVLDVIVGVSEPAIREGFALEKGDAVVRRKISGQRRGEGAYPRVGRAEPGCADVLPYR